MEIKLTPLLLSSLCEQRSHLHESCCVNMSILTTEAPFSDSVALGAGTVGQRRPLKHWPRVLGGRAAEERGAVLLGAQVGEHGCIERQIMWLVETYLL